MSNLTKKPTDSDYGTLEKRIRGCETVKRGNCRDCGNPWWHDLPLSWVCTTCAKTHGKCSSEEDNWKPKSQAPRQQVMQFEEYLKTFPQPSIVTRHYLADGLYAREITIPEDVVLTGAIHFFEHINVISKGHIRVWTEDQGWKDIKAPATIISKPGTKRLGITMSETIWTTFHANVHNEQDISKLEETLVTNSYEEADHFLVEQEIMRLKGEECLSG